MKKNFLKTNVALAIIFFGSMCLSHEGHHQLPGKAAAPHGGKMATTASVFVEVVADSEGFKLYAYDHDLKVLALDKFNLEGQVYFPRKKIKKEIQFQKKESYLFSDVKALGEHRYQLELQVTVNDKKEKLKMSIEPQ